MSDRRPSFVMGAFACLLAAGTAPAQPADEEEGKDVEVADILDEESEAEEAKESGPEEAAKEAAPAAKPAPPMKTADAFSEGMLKEEEAVDWDASFQKEFETEADEVVTPSKKFEDLFYAVPAVTLTRKPDILQLNAEDLEASTERTTGLGFIHMQDSAPSPVMRGLYGSRLPILFDGIRLTGALSPGGLGYQHGLMDLFSLSAIEVVGGPSPVLYGPDAMGGVINLLPQSPKVSPFVSKATNAEGFFRYSTLDASAIIHAETTLHTLSSGLVAAATYEDHGSLTSGEERQPFTGFERASLTFVAARQFLPSHELKLAYFFTRTDGTDRQVPGSSGQDSLSWDFHERHLGFTRYTGKDVGPLEELELTFGFQLFREHLAHTLTLLVDAPRSDKDRLTTGTMFGTLHLIAPLGGWGSLTYGTDYYLDRANGVAMIKESVTSDVTRTIPADRGIFENGAFASAFEHYLRLELFALHPVLLSVGGRAAWTYVDTQVKEGRSIAGGGAQVELRIPVVSRLKSTKFVTLSDILAFNVIGSFASRPPTLDELSALRTVPEGILYGNPDLENETMAGAQGGLKWNAGILDGFLYYGYSHFESFIMVRPLEDEAAVFGYDIDLCTAGYACWITSNEGKADLHTVELANQFNIRNFLKIGLTLAYTHGTEELPAGHREPMSYIPPLGGNVWIRAILVRFGLWGELRLKWAIAQDKLSTRDYRDPAICARTSGCGGTDGYLLLAFRGGIDITNRFSLSFAFNNLINQLYKTHGSTLNGPGIGASVSIDVKI